MPTRALATAALIAAGLAAAPAALADTFPGTELTLLSRTPSGGPAGGAAGGVAISGDGRRATVAAFDSTSSTLTPGTAPGVRNVFAVARAAPVDSSGSPWHAGAVNLVSTGLGGTPANGDSFGPALDGTTQLAPRCIAFVSSASNLVPNDTNGQSDAFVRNLRTGRITRVSVTATGGQANGPTSAVTIDGRCDAVAFVASAPNLALTRTRRPSWRSAVTGAPAPGTQQVYVHFLGGPRKVDKAVRGLTFLASATRGRPGDADSVSPAFSRNGLALAFASTASNLVGGDDNGASDIFERTFKRALGRRIHHHRVQFWRLATRVVSADANGASSDPAINVNGTAVAYTTIAPGLIGAPASAPQVVLTTLGGSGRTTLISHRAGGGPASGASGDASITDGASFVTFTSTAGDFGERNDDGVRPAPFVWVESSPRDLLELAAATQGAGTTALSPFGNYYAFTRGANAWLLRIGGQ